MKKRSISPIRDIMRVPFVLVLFLLALQGQVWAQRNTAPLTGKVTDATTGEAVSGATVRMKGSSKGVVTDSSGVFHLNAAPNAILIVSYVGYTDQEISASGNLSGIKLRQSGTALTDVVVVGYGTQKKATLTGAVSVVTAKTFEDRGPIASPVAALQGQVPGVVVTRSSGAPGREAWNFQIRGATSINSTDPLIIIDGIPVGNPLNAGGTAINSNPGNTGLGVTMNSANVLSSLNPSDIESISVLKDAAASIYGSRAAGGVVLITTKRARSGKPVIQYEGTVSTKKKALTYKLANVKQWGQGIMDALTNDYFGNPDKSYIWYRMGNLMINAPDSGYIDMNYTYTQDPATGKVNYVGTPVAPASNPINPGFGDVKDITFFNTNWNDVLWGGGAVSTTHNVSVSGRSEKSGYRLSLRYSDDGSLLKWGDNSNKLYNVRLSNDYTITDKLKMETTLSVEENDIVMPTMLTNGNVLSAYQQPGLPVVTKNGQPYAWGTQYSPNWQAALGGSTKEANLRVYTNLGLTYTFSKHLRFVGRGGYDPTVTDVKAQQKVIHWWNYAGTIQAADNPTQAAAYYQRQTTKEGYYNLNGYFEYHNTFASDHDLGVTVGSQYERDELDYYSAKTLAPTNDNVPSLNLSIGDPTTKTVNEQQSHWALGSYFGRLNYAYKGRYLFEAQARYDGSSRFAPEDRWKMFYGFSAGWRIIDEAFMKDQKTVSDLKLRASWGQVGNQNGIGLYDYINTLGSTVTGGPTSSGVPLLGANPVVYINPSGNLVSLNRKWETVQNENLGVDFGFLNNRLTGTFDYYIRNNTNMLIPITYPSVIGATAPATNSGHLRTWGWEGTLGWRDQLASSKLTYHVAVTLSDNQNKLVSYQGASVINPGYNSFVQGYALGTIFGLKYAGRVQDQKTADAVNAITAGNNISAPLKVGSQPGVRIGDNYYVDVNHDGKLTTPGDLINLGRDDPRYTYAVNLGLEWNGFDFSAIFQGVAKRAVYRGNNVTEVPYQNLYQGEGAYWVGKTWTPTNTGGFYPLLSGNQNGQTYNTYNYQPSSWTGTVQNGSYVRLKNLVLGYSIPNVIMQKIKIQRIRVYVSGQDLWEKTHIHDGWDPEATRTLSNLERFPFYRYLTTGLNVTF